MFDSFSRPQGIKIASGFIAGAILAGSIPLIGLIAGSTLVSPARAQIAGSTGTPSSPGIDLVIKFDTILETPTIFPEQRGKVLVTVTNRGSQALTQPFDIKLYASTNPKLDLGDVPLNVCENGCQRGTSQRLEGRDEFLGTLKIANSFIPGQSQTYTIDFASKEFETASVVSPGAYFFIAEVDSGKVISESKEDNNIAQGDDSQFISTNGTDVVLDWNSTLLNAIQAVDPRRLPGELPITSAPFAARNAAIVHTAIYRALMEAERTAGASREAAVVGAAYRTLNRLYPSEAAAYDAQRNRSLMEIQDSATAKNAGFGIGERIANQIVNERSNDGAASAGGPFTVPPTPGIWRPTPTIGDTAGPNSNGAPALLPGWGRVRPFSEPSVQALLNVLPNRTVDDVVLRAILNGPPPLGSLQYRLSVLLVKELGDRNRKPGKEQTDIAYFWAYDRSDTFGPPGQWQEITQEIALQQKNTLEENARLFALLTTAMADAGIVTWNLKYKFNQWRPITAIREADTVPNPGRIQDANWTPLLDSPPFPDYISGHASFGAAAGGILRRFFDTNAIGFDIPSQDLPGKSRSYDRINQAVRENALSRVYGGIHVGAAAVDGVVTGEVVGQAVADTVFDNFASTNKL